MRDHPVVVNLADANGGAPHIAIFYRGFVPLIWLRQWQWQKAASSQAGVNGEEERPVDAFEFARAGGSPAREIR